MQPLVASSVFVESGGRYTVFLAQMLAGHADIGTTANIYAHLDTSDLETALKALNEAKEEA